MRVITARNVNEALPIAVELIKMEGREENSRNGACYVMQCPVTTEYRCPTERVLFEPLRDANPFFHLMESIWMMSGRNDVKFLVQFASNMSNFSDDGIIFGGAYGHRWNQYFTFNQLLQIIDNFNSAGFGCRRQVLTMWGCPDLINQTSKKDIPCNLMCHFNVRDDKLDMTVFNRSNDIIWGCYGANVVHFSFLQEFMARSLGLEVGKYWQVSDNWHAYKNTLTPLEGLTHGADLYEDGTVEPYPLTIKDPKNWLYQAESFVNGDIPLDTSLDPFFIEVAEPIFLAHKIYKAGGNDKYEKTLKKLEECKATDWRLACEEWVRRRYTKFLKAQDDGVQYE